MLQKGMQFRFSKVFHLHWPDPDPSSGRARRRPGRGCPIVFLAMLFVILLRPVPGLAEGSPGEEAGGFTLREAIRITLENQVSIGTARVAVSFQKALLHQTRGAFDRRLSVSLTENLVRSPFTHLERLAYQVGHATSENYALNIGMARKNRAGVQILPVLQFSGTRASPPDRTPQLLGQGGITFSVIAPLQRGRGHDLDAASERAGQLEINAAELDFRQEVVKAVYRTIVSYWALQAAEENLGVRIRAVHRGRTRVETLKKLIAGDQAPAGDLVQTEADLTDALADFETAQQDVTQAQASLALALGLSRSGILACGPTVSPLPGPLPEEAKSSTEDDLVETGLARRHDLAALTARRKSAATLLPALRSQTRPRLDLRFDVGYTGLTEGGPVLRPVESLGRQTAGLNSTVKVAYEFPLENHAAEGSLRQQRERLAKLELEVGELTRTIRLDIQTAFLEVQRQDQALRLLSSSVDQYQEALRNEERKHTLGLATILDTLTMEDRLISAKLKKHEAQRGLAQAIAKLQLACGGHAFTMGSDRVLSLESSFPDPTPEGP
jgi:outer membrane protein TolC